MESPRVRIGELLVAAQIITAAQLDEVLERQKQDGRRLGKLLVEAELVTETQVTQILSQQLSVPWVSLYHIEFSRPLLQRIPVDLAQKFGVVPIFVRRVRGHGETLYIAMDDPSDEAAQAEVSRACGLPVRSMIAPPSDIRAAIRAYYLHGKSHASLSDAMDELAAEEGRPVAEPRRVPTEDKARKRPKPAPTLLLLTLPDGSEVELASPDTSGFTVRGLLSALREKQLIADFEFVSEDEG